MKRLILAALIICCSAVAGIAQQSNYQYWQRNVIECKAQLVLLKDQLHRDSQYHIGRTPATRRRQLYNDTKAILYMQDRINTYEAQLKLAGK